MSIRRNAGPNSVAEALSHASRARTGQVSGRLLREMSILLPLPSELPLARHQQLQAA
jgi:hypothetical protein